MNRIITRHEILGWVKSNNPTFTNMEIESVFRSMSDEVIARSYGFMVLRKGYFVI